MDLTDADEREGLEARAWVNGDETDLDVGVAEVASWVAEAHSLTVLTGAGLSTDSGIADFRGKNGVWTKSPEAEKASTLEYYLSSSAVRAAAWQMRLRAAAWTAEPNAGHRALVDMEHHGPLTAIVTQNIDGLQQLAGSDPDKVIEVHGTMRTVRCTSCGQVSDTREVLKRVEAGEDDPPCLLCGSILKSSTILFGEALREPDIAAAEAAAQRCDLLIAVGTTLAVYPVALLPAIASQNGARVVVVNGRPTEQDHLVDAVLRGSISAVLPALVPPARTTP